MAWRQLRLCVNINSDSKAEPSINHSDRGLVVPGTVAREYLQNRVIQASARPMPSSNKRLNNDMDAFWRPISHREHTFARTGSSDPLTAYVLGAIGLRNLSTAADRRSCGFRLGPFLTPRRAIVTVSAFVVAPTGNWRNLRLNASVHAGELKAPERTRRNLCQCESG